MELGRRLAIPGACALLVLLSGACRADTGSGPAATATPSGGPVASAVDRTPASSVATQEASCAPARTHAAGAAVEHIESGGLDRSYIINVPAQYDGAHALPLVMNFHGYASNARQQAAYSGLPAKGDAEGFIVVTPDGAGTPPRWTLAQAGGAANDIAFVRDVLDRLEVDLCIDASRVFAAGISNGSAFAQRVACGLPHRIAAIAAVAALVLPAQCDNGLAVPVIAFHGTADPCVPYEGGRSQCGLMLPVPAVEPAARAWAQHDGCAPEPALQAVSAHVRTIAYSECRDGAAVLLYVVDGGGHTWPGSIDVARLGETTHEINATDLMWEFFAGQTAAR